MEYAVHLKFLAYSIKQLLNDSDTIPDPAFREIIEFAHSEVKSLDFIATRMNWKGIRSLQTEINKESTRLFSKLEGAVKSHFSKLERESSSTELDDLKQDFRYLVARVKKMEEEYADALFNPLPPQEEEEEEDDDDDDDDIDVSACIGLELKMVGLSDQYYHLKEIMLEGIYFNVLPIIGMPGIGKTTLARKVFADPDVMKHFKVRVWVTVGRKCSVRQIQRRILARVDPDRLKQIVVERDIDRQLRENLKGKRYLIVLDDVWEKYMVYNLLPYEQNGSYILVTTRLEQKYQNLNMRLLNREESWDLLREKVFAQEFCSTRLEEAGKKIAANCEGLPLTIVTLADHLSKVKEVEYWEEVAAKKNHKLFKDAYDQISKVIRPSYDYLPRLLQSCFLYMGVFPQSHEVPRSKIISMWNVDGFLERNKNFDALICLEELHSNSLVMIYKSSSSHVGYKRIKTCGLHSSLWHSSTSEASKTKFCHVLSSLDDGLKGDMIGQQRLSFHNNILCTIKDVYKYVEDNCASTVRSLLYYGPYNPYQVPICFGLRLLRELDVLTIRFYKFPMEVLQLVELRYLALTWDGKLPASISQLSNLRFLTVGRHFIVIKPSRDRYLPAEIWNMQELQHLQVVGSDLSNPPHRASLENLSTLSNVSACSCTEEVFKAIPNLEKLGVQIELGPNDEDTPLRCLDHIYHLQNLKSLKCVVVNPKVVPPLASITFLPSSLSKLSLSGLGFPWKEMTKIAALPKLQTLKLQNYAFRGPYWRVKEFGFPKLRSLVIEDTDLVEWSLGSQCFNWLFSLVLKHCYKYERMVGKLGDFVYKIEFFACNPLGILQMQETLQSPDIKWGIHSSFTHGDNKTRSS